MLGHTTMTSWAIPRHSLFQSLFSAQIRARGGEENLVRCGTMNLEALLATTARLLDCSTARLLDCSTARLLDYSTTRLLDSVPNSASFRCCSCR
jgi:hypothetical protein